MKATLIALGFAAIVGCSGTLWGEGVSTRIEVSPDGNWIAYSYSNHRYIPLPPDPVLAQQVAYLYWAPTAEPEKVVSIKIAEWGWKQRHSHLSGRIRFVFSPNGARIAVSYPSHLMFVDTDGGQAHRQSLDENEWITSMAWLDDETLGYVSHSEIQKDQGGQLTRTIWRQRFDQTTAERDIIHQDADVQHTVSRLDWPLEYWSPDARFVVMRAADRGAATQLLDVARREVSRLTSIGALMRATWSHDGQQVFYCTWFNGHKRAFLHTVGETDIQDLSEEWRNLFDDAVLNFELLWTPDNRFIAGNDLEKGGYLVSPDPWEIRLLGKELVRPGSAGLPNLRSQVVANLLVVKLAPDEVLVDYMGQIVKELGDGGLSGWTVLPGGQQAVSVGLGNIIVVESLE